MSFPFAGGPFVSDLDTPLLALTPRDYFTVRDACAGGVSVFGGPGGGKTTGIGAALAGAFLRAGFGMLVLTTKYEDIPLWQQYTRDHGRSRSLILFDETRGYNFLDYELSRHGAKGIANSVECLMQILSAADHAMNAAGGRESDPFWSQSIRQVLQYALPLLFSAWGSVTVAQVVDFVTSAAPSAEHYTDPAHSAFQQRSFASRTLRKAANDPAVKMSEAELRPFFTYWIAEYTAIPEKTRGNIVISLSSKLDRFRHGRMRDCFCGKTDILPEMTWHGAVIVMAMPPQTWNEDGIIAQMLFKYMWMRAMQSRNSLAPEHRIRPVALFVDEAHTHVAEADNAFLAVSRSLRTSVVYMSQDLPSYYAKVGANNTNAINGLLGKFSNHVFHLNSCTTTNKYASDLIGRGMHRRATVGSSVGSNTTRGMNEGDNVNWGRSTNEGSSYGASTGGASYSHNSGSSRNNGEGENRGVNVGRGTNTGRSWSTAETLDNLVEPNFFATGLKSGGPQNNRLVTGLWFRAGARFAPHGRNYTIATFRQRGSR